jgi:twitching motility protein PilT
VLPSPLARLVLLAAEVHATDLHLCTGERPSVRLDRGLAPLEGEPPLDELPWLDSMLPAHAHAVDLGFDSPSGHRLRVHVYRHDRGLAAAVRILPGGVPSLHRLGFPLPIDDLASLRHGLVLFGGPVGSGKSTSMFALAREVLRARGGVAVTIEDPVEFPFAPDTGAAVVRQRLVGRDVPSMAAGLRQALREDPDMIVLSELRDAESILLALTAAETGTLVLATMHCRSGASAVERILDSVPPERLKQAQGQLAEALRAVVVQRLLPRADRNGRALAVEILRGTRAVASQIREGKTGNLTTTIQTSARDGMMPLERSLTQLVEQRRITLDTARHHCNDADSLAQMLRQVGEGG